MRKGRVETVCRQWTIVCCPDPDLYAQTHRRVVGRQQPQRVQVVHVQLRGVDDHVHGLEHVRGVDGAVVGVVHVSTLDRTQQPADRANITAVSLLFSHAYVRQNLPSQLWRTQFEPADQPGALHEVKAQHRERVALRRLLQRPRVKLPTV